MTLLDHAGDNVLCHDVGGDEVDVDDLTEVLGLHLKHGNALDDAGVVDKDVNGAEVALDVGDQLDDVFLIGDVGEVAVSVDAFLTVGGQSGLHVVLTAAVERDLCACGSVCLCNGEADAVCGAGNKSYFSFQGKLLHNVHNNCSPFRRLRGSR